MIRISTQKDGEDLPVYYDSKSHRLIVDGVEIVSNTHLYGPIRELRIVFGNACNFQCKYCQQEKQIFPNKSSDMHAFLHKLELYMTDTPIHRINLYGGEAFMYFDQLVQYHKELRRIWPTVDFLIYTNGRLFSNQIADWCIKNQIKVVFSYDGPGQHVRGIDPFDYEDVRQNVRRYINEVGPLVTAPVISRYNRSYKAYAQNLQEKLNITDNQYRILTMAPVRAVTEQMLDLQVPNDDLIDLSAGLYGECLKNPQQVSQWGIINTAADLFTRHLGNPLPRKWRCNAANLERIIVDMHGNVQKCQFYDYNSVDEDTGEQLGFHNIEGHHFSQKKPPEFIKWRRRMDEYCAKCPVVQICQGDCPYAPNQFFKQNCKQMYHFFLVSLALAVNQITGRIMRGVDFDINQHQQQRLIDSR